MTQDEIRDYIVCINGGSGVIFQPADETVTYILTAKHIFEDIGVTYNNLVTLNYFSSAVNSFTLINPFELNDNNYFPHPEEGVDIAILKIPRINGRNNLIRTDQLEVDTDGYCLIGLPKLRRNENEPISQNWFRPDNGVQIRTPRNFKRREANLGNNPNKTELEGSSGGGIVRISGENLLIAGIQSQVVSLDEVLGNVEFTPIQVFDEIVTHYANSLEAILPCYMNSFSFLRDSAFRLEVDVFDEESIAFTRNYLKNKAHDVINSGITPNAIKKFFRTRLLVDSADETVLLTNHVWRIWLEFLTIMNIVKYEQFDENNLNEIFNSFRLKYLNTAEDWLSRNHLGHLRNSDYKGLKLGSKIFIGTNNPPIRTMRVPKGKLIDIAKVYDKSKFLTDAGIDPFTSFEFIHTDYLQKNCIIEKLENYAAITDEAELLNALKTEYEALLNG